MVENGFKICMSVKDHVMLRLGDDTAHPIAHVGNVPLSMQDGKVKYLVDVLHEPKITKNLVSVGLDG